MLSASVSAVASRKLLMWWCCDLRYGRGSAAHRSAAADPPWAVVRESLRRCPRAWYSTLARPLRAVARDWRIWRSRCWRNELSVRDIEIHSGTRTVDCFIEGGPGSGYGRITRFCAGRSAGANRSLCAPGRAPQRCMRSWRCCRNYRKSLIILAPDRIKLRTPILL
jgi:hypothetical protein